MDYRWDDLKVFLALMREGTLAGAASRVGVDASTVSRRLAAFEEAVGASLFDRTRDGLRATAAAEHLLPAAEEAERSALRFVEAAQGLEAEAEGVVRLTAPPALAELFVVPALTRLREKHPRIRVELDASTQLADLTRREADLALRAVHPTGGDLVSRKVMSAPYGVLTSPRYARQLGTLRAWDSARWVTWEAAMTYLPMMRWLSRHAPLVEPVLRSASITVQLAAAESGLGVALLPRVLCGVRALVPVTVATPLRPALAELPVEDLWLVGHRALRDVPRVAAVWDFLVEEAGALQAAETPGRVASSKR